MWWFEQREGIMRTKVETNGNANATIVIDVVNLAKIPSLPALRYARRTDSMR